MSNRTRMVRAPPNTSPPPDLSGRRFFIPNHSTNLTTNMEVN